MSNFQRLRTLKKEDITLKRVAQGIWRRIDDITQKLILKLPLPFTARNRKGLESFKNIHQNKRCFIIANGPSLKNVDFSLLKDEYTIGMNRIYIMKEQNGFSPTYLACID